MTDHVMGPRTSDAGSGGGSTRDVRLYSPFAVGLATFLGSPLAGGIVMAINYRRMGRPWAALHAVLWPGLFVLLFFVGAVFAPEGAGASMGASMGAVPLPLTIGMIAAAKVLQGFRIDTHQSEGGALASNWGAAGIGVLCLGLVMAAIFGLAFAPGFLPAEESSPWGSRYVDFDEGNRVFHSEDIPPQLAESAGRAMIRSAGWEKDMVFRMTREGRTYVIWLMLIDRDMHNDAGIVNAWRGLAAETSALALEAAPVAVRFCDGSGILLRAEKPLDWGRLLLASTDVRVLCGNGVTKEEAGTVRLALLDMKVFSEQDPGRMHLRRSGEGYEFHILLTPDVAADKENMAAWNDVIRKLSTRALDGKPLKFVPVVSANHSTSARSQDPSRQ